MIFVCPQCRQAYTLGQCHIPSNKGARATVICVCKTALEVSIVAKPVEEIQRRFYFWKKVIKREELIPEVKLRGKRV